MVKYIVLLLVLYGLEALASPSFGNRGSMSDGCGGTVPCAQSMISSPALNSISEDLSRAIERAVAAAIAQSIKDFSTTTPAPTPIGFREEIANIVSAAVKQTMKELTPSSFMNEEIASIVGSCQRTVQNLTRIVEQLTVPTSSTTMTPVPNCAGEFASAVACQETVRNLTTIVAQLAAPTTTTPAPAPRCDCDEQVALSLKNQTRTQPELTQSGAQQTCVPGYEYSNVTKHCYKLHEEEVHWPIAESKCREEGGLLAVTNSREESHVLANIQQRIYEYGICYIGVFRDSDGHWKTVTGEDVEEAAGFHLWSQGEPTGGDEWGYAMLYADGSIATAEKISTGMFICEMAA